MAGEGHAGVAPGVTGEGLLGAVENQRGGYLAAVAGEVPGAQAQLVDAVIELLRIEICQNQRLRDSNCRCLGCGESLPDIAAGGGKLQLPAHQLRFGKPGSDCGARPQAAWLAARAGIGQFAAPGDQRCSVVGRVLDAQGLHAGTGEAIAVGGSDADFDQPGLGRREADSAGAIERDTLPGVSRNRRAARAHRQLRNAAPCVGADAEQNRLSWQRGRGWGRRHSDCRGGGCGVGDGAQDEGA